LGVKLKFCSKTQSRLSNKQQLLNSILLQPTTLLTAGRGGKDAIARYQQATSFNWSSINRSVNRYCFSLCGRPLETKTVTHDSAVQCCTD